MKISKIEKNNETIAVVESKEYILTDVQAALDLIMTVQYETGTNKIAINKEAIVEEFFILSSGLAGEVLQKFINYDVRFAIYGDFSKYTSKPLKDFIYECNHGKDFFFVTDENEATDKLSL